MVTVARWVVVLPVLLLACAAGADATTTTMTTVAPREVGWTAGPGPLPVAEAWAAAASLCRNGTRPSARPMLIFVHIFKAAGTTTRTTLREWAADRAGAGYRCRFARARLCGDGFEASTPEKVCAKDGRPRMAGSLDALDVVAGHLRYGSFATPRPTVYVTCLREPLELRVSGLLYKLGTTARANAPIAEVAALATARWRASLERKPRYDNFLKRLGSAPGDVFPDARRRPGRGKARAEPLTAVRAADHATRAIAALESSFAVVGLTERYALFYAQLAALLPGEPPEFWDAELRRRENAGLHSTSAVRSAIDPTTLAAINATLVYERRVYDAAVAVHDRRCAEYLGADACS